MFIRTWETILRTPLLMRIPGAASGVRRELVDNLDVVPTVLDYLGLSRRRPGSSKGSPTRWGTSRSLNPCRP
jgi:arylsulfatase A-like enzyme